MAITSAEYFDYLVKKVPLGYIAAFTIDSLYSLSTTIPVYSGANLNHTYTASSGALSGQSITVRPLSISVRAPENQSGIKTLAGGRVYDPWGAAGKRAPTSWPQYTQRMIYHGNVGIVLNYYEVLLGFAGITGLATFSYGRQPSGAFGLKQCAAALLSVNGNGERVLNPANWTAKTMLEITATFQQTSDFWAV